MKSQNLSKDSCSVVPCAAEENAGTSISMPRTLTTKRVSHDKNRRLFENLRPDELLTAEQLAALLNVSAKTIRKWRYERKLPQKCMVKIGSHLVRYVSGEVLVWLNNEKGS